MAIASFASKVFQANSDRIYTFDDFQYSSSIQTEKQDSAGSKPSTYNKGSDLDTMSFKVKLDISFGVNPRREWEDWKSIMNSQRAYPFILGGRPLGAYLWQLTSVTPGGFVVDNDGNILLLELDLKFDEYVRAGSLKEKKSKSTSGSKTESFSEDEFDLLIE